MKTQVVIDKNAPSERILTNFVMLLLKICVLRHPKKIPCFAGKIPYYCEVTFLKRLKSKQGFVAISAYGALPLPFSDDFRMTVCIAHKKHLTWLIARSEFIDTDKT